MTSSLGCNSDDYVFCDNPCADFNASVISTGYSCHQNPCDCTVFFAGILYRPPFYNIVTIPFMYNVEI